MKAIPLIGHSGCKLILEENNGVLSVVKTSKDISYNKRLEIQYEKQKKFQHESFLSPKVVSSKQTSEGLFQFSMDYINGVRLADLFHTIPLSSIKEIANHFIRLIPSDITFDPNASKIFYEKIENLKGKIEKTNSVPVQEALQMLRAYQWGNLQKNSCHGDLTLENIIVTDNALYLIDFLDSFYESWMIDFAKLFQDLECFWSYRYLEKRDENLEIRLSIFKRILTDSVLSQPHGHELFKTIYYILLINLVRIVPYVKDEHTEQFLDAEIQKVINIIKQLP